ncbi:MAG: hypothetical protein KGO81_11415 [Bacteroidota bacterium]|nr:hypothetical protein [Bacteroidota bacterium]
MKLSELILKLLFLVSVWVTACEVHAQVAPYRPGGQTDYQSASGQNYSYDRNGVPIKTKKQDSLQHRDRYADSITIFYRYYDSTRLRTIDSSINDFTTRFPQPYWYNTLGNFGTAAQSLLFSPIMKAGWDEGLHQYDMYNFTLENTKLYQTTRPYTELAYLLGNKAEQLVQITHTQNKRSNFNFSFEYRFTNAPGVYKTQNASNNNLRVTTHYQSPNKRYESFLIFITNKNASSENGGLRNPKDLDSLSFNNPFEVNTRLGTASIATTNPFNTTVNTGNIYKQNTFLYRHQYDFGQKDSIVLDTITRKLFYARFRLQHTITINTNSYNFRDVNADSTLYSTYFNYSLPSSLIDTVNFKDAWSIVTNEFSLISFPDKKNQSQFLKVGAAYQNLKATFADTSSNRFHNIYLLGEYRNRTRNQVWDVDATGQLYMNGMNAGDYAAYISLKRQLGKKIGNLQLGFQNVNRTPSFIFDPMTNFPVNNKTYFKKENLTRLFAAYENPRASFRLAGEYYLVSNYAYFDSFFVAKQASTLFNFLHISAEKKFRLARYWNWYTEVHLQQITGDAPVHVPFFLTRNRIAFEGNFYTNLFLSTGLEIRYFTNYQADGYSPMNGQFYYQNDFTTANTPDVNFFFDVRIKSFKAFVRFENLNTLNTAKGFTFDKYNFNRALYPSQGLWFRFGLWWNFVN